MTAGVPHSFKGAASTIMGRLRSSLDVSAYDKVQRIGGKKVAPADMSYDDDLHMQSSGHSPLLGAADAMVHLARSSRVMPSPRGSGSVPGINMDLLHGRQGSSGGGTHSPRVFSPRQSADFGRRSMGDSTRRSVDLQQPGSMGQRAQQPDRRSFDNGGNRGSNRVSLQEVRPSVPSVAEEPLLGRGNARFSQTYAEQSPRGQASRMAPNGEGRRSQGGGRPGIRFSQQVDGLV